MSSELLGVTTFYSLEVPDILGPAIRAPIDDLSSLAENLILWGNDGRFHRLPGGAEGIRTSDLRSAGTAPSGRWSRSEATDIHRASAARRLLRGRQFIGQVGIAPEGDLGLAGDELGRGKQQRRAL
jgi:hypothetical protein